MHHLSASLCRRGSGCTRRDCSHQKAENTCQQGSCRTVSIVRLQWSTSPAGRARPCQIREGMRNQAHKVPQPARRKCPRNQEGSKSHLRRRLAQLRPRRQTALQEQERTAPADRMSTFQQDKNYRTQRVHPIAASRQLQRLRLWASCGRAQRSAKTTLALNCCAQNQLKRIGFTSLFNIRENY